MKFMSLKARLLAHDQQSLPTPATPNFSKDLISSLDVISTRWSCSKHSYTVDLCKHSKDSGFGLAGGSQRQAMDHIPFQYHPFSAETGNIRHLSHGISDTPAARAATKDQKVSRARYQTFTNESNSSEGQDREGEVSIEWSWHSSTFPDPHFEHMRCPHIVQRASSGSPTVASCDTKAFSPMDSCAFSLRF